MPIEKHRRTSDNKMKFDDKRNTQVDKTRMNPSSNPGALTVEDATAAFHDKNQGFLKNYSSSRSKKAVDPKSRTIKPPRPTTWGNSAGRGTLTPILDGGEWSSSENLKKKRSKESYSVVSNPSLSSLGSMSSRGEMSSQADSSSWSSKRPLSNQKAESLEQQLFASLVSKAHNDKVKGHSKNTSEFSSIAYDDYESLGTSFISRSSHSRTSSWCSGYSGDDNLSLFTYGSGTSKDDSNISGGGRTSQLSKYQKEKREIRKKQEKKFIKQFIREMKNERETMISQFREELRRENQRRDIVGNAMNDLYEKAISFSTTFTKFLSYVEVLISNMPLTIGAVGLSWVTQGTIWFKFMEENIDSCTTVPFFSRQCTYPEFPGCFECDVENPIYRGVLTFHYFCHIVALICCLIFLAKCAIAWRVVADELSNPTTSTPCGVVCITLICVAAGRGMIGEATVLITSVFHFILSLWFLYIAIYEFRLWPDPGWFPNTVGLAYAAVKSWLYYPFVGLIFMSFTMTYLFSTFFVAIYRAYYNHKIAAPVCFISLSAPSITMYAMTIMAQPNPATMALIEESPEAAARFRELHRNIYLPVQHCMMILSLIGFMSSLHCLWARWPKFRHKEFSPAHVAFIFPILSHTNAVQAYRSGVDSFSNIPIGSPLKIILFSYWFTCLIVGTTLNLIFTYKYLRRIPKWTKLDTAFLQQEQELQPPPSPCHTFVHEMLLEESGAHECLNQTFTSPAVLQANEAGTLIRVRRGTEEYNQYGPYVRTRQVSALGFELILTETELRQERAELLNWVAKNAPRTRNRTLSIPQMFKLRGAARTQQHSSAPRYGTFGADNGNEPSEEENQNHHRRSLTWAWGV